MITNKALKGSSGDEDFSVEIIKGHETVGRTIHSHSFGNRGGSLFLHGLVTLSDNLSGYTKGYFQEHNLSDLNVYYSQISAEDVADLGGIEGIQLIEGRYTVQAEQAFEDDKICINGALNPRTECNQHIQDDGGLDASRAE